MSMNLIDPSGTAVSADSGNTLDGGTYCWRAEYDGDALYRGATHTNDSTECFTVQRQLERAGEPLPAGEPPARGEP